MRKPVLSLFFSVVVAEVVSFYSYCSCKKKSCSNRIKGYRCMIFFKYIYTFNAVLFSAIAIQDAKCFVFTKLNLCEVLWKCWFNRHKQNKKQLKKNLSDMSRKQKRAHTQTNTHTHTVDRHDQINLSTIYASYRRKSNVGDNIPWWK